MRRKVVEYIFIILVLSPLLFINIRSSHDWGDDFAGYINQARNISEGKPFYETKMLPQDYMPSYAPPYYSYGFPLLLAPVIKVFGIDFKAMDRYISLWLVLWVVLIFYYLRRRFSFFTSVSFILILFINPFFFRFKTEILSDIPFAFFFTLSMLLFIDRGKLSLLSKVLFGIVIGFTIGIRDLGLLFVMLIAADILLATIHFSFGKITRGEWLNQLRGNGIILGACFIFVFIFSRILFKSPGSQLGHFASLYYSPNYWDTFIYNLDVYTRLFESLFRHDTGKYTFALYYSTAFMLVLTIIGFIHLCFRSHKWELLLFVIYGFIVLLFPFSSQGFRYLLPVIPIIMLCAIYGAKAISLPLALNRYFVASVFVLFMLWVNAREIRTEKLNQHNTIWPGPMTDESLAAFDFIKTSLPEKSLIATVKPRAVMLFTDRYTCLIPKNATAPFIVDQLRDIHPHYLLHIKDIYTDVVNDVASLRGDSLIWEYHGSKIYKCRDRD